MFSHRSAHCQQSPMKGDCVAIAAAIARNCEFRYEIASLRVSNPRSPGFFSKCPPFPWRMPGFGRAPTRPNGDVGYDPAGPPDGHGGWPGIGQWGGGRRCHPGGGMRPPKRHGMRNAPVQKAPVHGFGDGPMAKHSKQKRRCVYSRQHLNVDSVET